MLDAESFDYAYDGKDSVGFRFVIADQSDKAMLKQDGYLISPGKFRIQQKEELNIIFFIWFILYF